MAKAGARVLVFGNPMLREDSMPLKLMHRLGERFPDIKFVEFDPNDDLEREGKELNIIDCVQGIKKVMLITDIEKVMTPKIYSMHDYDLGHSLKLLKKFGYVDNIRVFGVPMKMDENKAFKQLSGLISATLS